MLHKFVKWTRTELIHLLTDKSFYSEEPALILCETGSRSHSVDMDLTCAHNQKNKSLVRLRTRPEPVQW